eukprot:CAMPEP_0119565238 /NCGR_PEP_ID=MMETSP1352-20130426/29374_1 /TAXON_ID=265584 /ORGANISM="Stauroneis constricta, Strain CCMP1120" /LENGTH=445 /DNA_ID=CAMNT_0007614111 /DNA_START=92 /DNA_END=1426 /DNA_ORIENTATION=-
MSTEATNEDEANTAAAVTEEETENKPDENAATDAAATADADEEEDAEAEAADTNDDDDDADADDTNDFEELVKALKADFPEATNAECQRFARSCFNNNNAKKKKKTMGDDDDTIQKEAEKLLEGYLDFRSCYGLDYSSTNDGDDNDKNNGSGKKSSSTATTDADDWIWAAEKALGVLESTKKAKEMEEQMKKAAAANKNGEDSKKDGNLPDIHQVLEEAEKAEADAAAAASASEDDDAGKETDNGTKNDSSDKEAAAKEGDENNDETSNADTKAKSDGPTVQDMPQLVFMHKNEDGSVLTDKSGSTILHCIPAQVNKRKIDLDTHANSFAFYLDRKFDRNSDERMTVVIDTRPGEGWPNPLAFTMISFVRRVAALLQALYPERCERLVVYPLPSIAIHVWRAVKIFMQKDIADKVILGAGSAGMKSPLPKASLLEHFDESTLDKL